MTLPLLDTNVVLRHLLQDHGDQSPRATALFERIRDGDLVAHISDTVMNETAFTLERGYKQARELIRDAMLDLLDEPNLLLAGKSRWRRILHIYVERKTSLGDAQQIELMERMALDEIITFDKDFDRIPGITRIEP